MALWWSWWCSLLPPWLWDAAMLCCCSVCEALTGRDGLDGFASSAPPPSEEIREQDGWELARESRHGGTGRWPCHEMCCCGGFKPAEEVAGWPAASSEQGGIMVSREDSEVKELQQPAEDEVRRSLCQIAERRWRSWTPHKCWRRRKQRVKASIWEKVSVWVCGQAARCLCFFSFSFLCVLVKVKSPAAFLKMSTECHGDLQVWSE